MPRDLSRSLHALTARADRAADRILRREYGLAYRRFLLLYAVLDADETTQREVAERLGITEPSVSRMVRALVDEGLVTSSPVPGNRRSLMLTAAGRELTLACGALLEDRFAALVEASGVSYEDYRSNTLRVLAQLAATGSTQ